MQIEKLNIKNNKKLIVFFSGWGSIIPQNLLFLDFDVLLFHDYKIVDQISNLVSHSDDVSSTPSECSLFKVTTHKFHSRSLSRNLLWQNFDFSKYEKKYLIAWSLGVYVCNYYYEIFKDFDDFTAINGTLKPIDDSFGIPVDAYNLTINNFNEMTCKKFIKKISSPFEITKNIENLKQELISIKNLKIEKFLPFNKAIISTKDKIFPYKNMLSFWTKNNVKIEELDAPHYVFNQFKCWSDLI